MTTLAKRADILESLAQDVLGVILNSVTGIDEAEIRRQWDKYYRECCLVLIGSL